MSYILNGIRIWDMPSVRITSCEIYSGCTWICFDRGDSFPFISLHTLPYFDLSEVVFNQRWHRKALRTVLSLDAVAKQSPSRDHAQSQIIRPWLLSAATARYPVFQVDHIIVWRTCANLPPSSCDSNNRQDLSLETDSRYRSSGLNAIRVTVKLWPGRGCPTCLNVWASYSRITACSDDVALQAVAMRCRELDTPSVID